MHRGDYLKVYNPSDRAWHEGWAMKPYGFDAEPISGFILFELNPFTTVWVNLHDATVEHLGDCIAGYDFMFETETEWRRYDRMMTELHGVEDDQIPTGR